MAELPVLLETSLQQILFRRGKVRDTYDLGDKLLMVVTDRISAFDVVLPCGIPDKGAVLNQLSAFWFKQTEHIVPNHVVEVIQDIHQLDAYKDIGNNIEYPVALIGRTMVVKKSDPVPVECVVRGYIAGSGWADYTKSSVVSGIKLPDGLKECQQMAEPIFTPSTKAESGHDEPISMDDLKQMVGSALALELERISLEIYRFAEEYARTRGIIIADTKMEFGFVDDKLILVDELLTPDSSRFWDADSYEVGHSQPSFDKQPVRDWLTDSGWSKEPPAPMLPPEVIEQTSERYREAHRRLTGQALQV